MIPSKVLPDASPVAPFAAPPEPRLNSYPIIVEKLTEEFDVDPDRISRDASLTDLGLDSLAVVELVFELEEELGVELDEDQASFTTLGEAAETLDRLVAERAAAQD